MLGWRPYVIYKYLWKYICLLAMLALLGVTTVNMFMKTPTYMAWNQAKVFNIDVLILYSQYKYMLLILCKYHMMAIFCAHCGSFALTDLTASV